MKSSFCPDKPHVSLCGPKQFFRTLDSTPEVLCEQLKFEAVETSPTAIVFSKNVEDTQSLGSFSSEVQEIIDDVLDDIVALVGDDFHRLDEESSMWSVKFRYGRVRLECREDNLGDLVDVAREIALSWMDSSIGLDEDC